ncbi:MAG: helix-turn-helix domain-containing protein [Verrucomicrobiota bacterium]
MEKPEFQSLLYDDLEIHVDGFLLKRVVLNRHMPKVDRVSLHEHTHHQALVYLKGGGHQIIENLSPLEVVRGDVLMLPSGLRHGFRKKRELPPLCLSINFEIPNEAENFPIHSKLHARQLNRIERVLIRLADISNPFHRSADILNIFGILIENISGTTPKKGPLTVRVEAMLKTIPPSEWVPHKLAEQLAKPLHQLNRELHLEGADTVGKIISEKRLTLTKQLLTTTDLSVGEIGTKAGILDQNYFARWFKRETGKSPTRFRQDH